MIDLDLMNESCPLCPAVSGGRALDRDDGVQRPALKAGPATESGERQDHRHAGDLCADVAQEAETNLLGSLPALRIGTTPTPAAYAKGAAIRNPRASTPATTSKSPLASRIPSITARNAGPSSSSGVMSLNRMPGWGKS